MYANGATGASRQRWKAAADSFRMPYWDWGLGEGAGSVPDFFIQEKIMADSPDGKTAEIWNPLYAFYFVSIPDGFSGKVRPALFWTSGADSSLVHSYQQNTALARLRCSYLKISAAYDGRSVQFTATRSSTICGYGVSSYSVQ